MLTAIAVYDIQTSYKGAVYSVKLKMEFTILNQLMNLVRGNLRDASTSSPHTGTHTGSKSQHFSRSGVHNRSTYRGSELGHSAGAYSRMDEEVGKGIKLKDLRSTDVLKTTTTEVRVDKIDKIDEESLSSPDKGRSSASSSEVYIIEHHGKSSK